MGSVSLTPVKLGVSQIRAVACGEAHTLLLDGTGAVLSFGWGEQGQLGVELEGAPSARMQRVELPFKVNRISSGAVFSAALSEFGNLYVWGNGEQGQLGLGTKVCRANTPLLLSRLKHELLVDFLCGDSHMFCITSTGKIFGWGKGIVGLFEDYVNFPNESEVVSFSPKQLQNIEIAHRFIVA